MRLLFDQNLSPRLVTRLADLYADSIHVSQVGLDRATDLEVWEYARANRLIIVTKDADFGDLAVLYGTPPQVLWLRIGNATTDTIEQLLRDRVLSIADFAQNPDLAVLTLL